MCRSADDCGLVLSVIAGRDKLHDSARRFAYGESGASKRRYCKRRRRRHLREHYSRRCGSNFENSLGALNFTNIEPTTFNFRIIRTADHGLLCGGCVSGCLERRYSA